jgi:23S rRNA pseudouridine1911/1915/1917 synthase
MADASLPGPGAIIAGEADGDDGDDAVVEERVATVAAAQHGERLDKAIVAFVDEFSRNHLQHLVRSGDVVVDGTPATSPAQRVRAGQRIAVRLQPTAESRAYVAEALPLAVVHEDRDLLVLDKAAGIPRRATGRGRSSTRCSRATRRAPRCRAPASSIVSTRTPRA